MMPFRINYLEIEGYVEETITGDGDRQGGSIDIVVSEHMKRWTPLTR